LRRLEKKWVNIGQAQKQTRSDLEADKVRIRCNKVRLDATRSDLDATLLDSEEDKVRRSDATWSSSELDK
ncbi:hypothetical protein SESBI_38552, partial [Sesbania bispinosa]